MKRGVNKIKKHKSNIIVYILRSILLLFIAIVVYNIFLLTFTAKTDKEAKYIFGYRAYIITTDSMRPNIKVGDIVIIKKTENEKLNKNDIIIYRLSSESERVTHRIVDKSKDIYITKGDNNKLEDNNIVKYENIEGKIIFKIPFIGKIFLKSENVFYVFFLSITILTAYMYNRRLLNKSLIRREKKREADRIRQIQEEVKKVKEHKDEDIEIEFKER